MSSKISEEVEQKITAQEDIVAAKVELQTEVDLRSDASASRSSAHDYTAEKYGRYDQTVTDCEKWLDQHPSASEQEYKDKLIAFKADIINSMLPRSTATSTSQ